jgi:NAD+ synthase (glutamine-hydrolysing)
VFDEDRYFEPATENKWLIFGSMKLGLTVCEDVWNDEDFWRESRGIRESRRWIWWRRGRRLILNVSASPWHLGKNRTRHAMLRSLARKTGVPLVYCNLVGGNDELVFDGCSLVLGKSGELVGLGASFAEDFVVVETERGKAMAPEAMGDEEKVYRALVMGLRDYLHKCGFRSAVLGLSGGIDSAVTACLAATALGRENVRGWRCPRSFRRRAV